MKKLLCLLMLTTLLLGCTDAERKESSVEEATQVTTEKYEISLIEDESCQSIRYETEEHFLNDYRNVMGEEMPSPLMIEYDEEKYDFVKAILDGYHYTYILGEKDSGKRVNIRIIPDPIANNITEYSENLDAHGEELRNIVINGKEHEVYLWIGKYDEKPDYNLSYMPIERNLVTVSVIGNMNGTTKDEVISCTEDIVFMVYT